MMELRVEGLEEMVKVAVKQAIWELNATKPPKSDGVRLWMNKTQAADYIGVSRQTLDGLITDGLPAAKLSAGRYVLNKHDIDDWLKKRA